MGSAVDKTHDHVNNNGIIINYWSTWNIIPRGVFLLFVVQNLTLTLRCNCQNYHKSLSKLWMNLSQSGKCVSQFEYEKALLFSSELMPFLIMILRCRSSIRTYLFWGYFMIDHYWLYVCMYVCTDGKNGMTRINFYNAAYDYYKWNGISSSSAFSPV